MKLYLDKQTRCFCGFLLLFLFLFFFSGIGLLILQGNILQNQFLLHDNAVVSSLLEQGVSKQVIALAITNTSSSREGMELLSNIGVTENTSISLLPFVTEFQRVSGYSMLLVGGFLSVLLLGGTFLYLWKREELYLQATKVISCFTEGDFSCHMPEWKEGTIYRLFSSIDQLSMMLQAKNESVNKAKEFLKNTIADISHQLKTPITALSIYNEIIAGEPDNIEIVKEYSRKSGFSLRRLEQLTHSLLKITRLDAGSISFERESYFVSEVISRAISELTARAKEEGKEILVEESPEETIVCDLQWTSEAIGNIVKNALDHTEAGGKIHISWKRTPAMIRIQIADNGAGIPPEDLHHIFKRFYRSKKSLDKQGAGLGLALSKAILEGQGGIISVQSKLGEGTVFTISFLTEM